jgi:hypothetical protein
VHKLQENTNKKWKKNFNEALKPNYMGVSPNGSTKLEGSFGGKIRIRILPPFL